MAREVNCRTCGASYWPDSGGLHYCSKEESAAGSAGGITWPIIQESPGGAGYKLYDTTAEEAMYGGGGGAWRDGIIPGLQIASYTIGGRTFKWDDEKQAWNTPPITILEPRVFLMGEEAKVAMLKEERERSTMEITDKQKTDLHFILGYLEGISVYEKSLEKPIAILRELMGEKVEKEDEKD